MHNKQSLSYTASGIHIDRAHQLVDRIKKMAQRTHRPGVLGQIGGFGGLFALPIDRFKQPVLVSGTDGVGTKLKLAIAMNAFDTIGIDLVAMCVNDVVTSGAEPLFFLDYFATAALNLTQAESLMEGITRGCELAGAALIGGETAEMPDLYHGKDFDLAGFCVGIVERSAIIDGSRVQVGDALIALASSGPHSNGYSLIRRILEIHQSELDQPFNHTSLGHVLLTPTRIYVKSLLQLIKTIDVRALAHITGGGLLENIPRVLPPYTQAILRTNSWTWPKIFQWIQHHGHVAIDDMWRTFNVGVGMVLCVSSNDVDKTLAVLSTLGETAWVIGHIVKNDQCEPSVMMD